MDFLQPALDGFGVVLQPTNLLYCLLGVVIGMLIGVLPGLGPAATIAILLPLTYGIEPVTAIIMLAGIFYVFLLFVFFVYVSTSILLYY